MRDAWNLPGHIRLVSDCAPLRKVALLADGYDNRSAPGDEHWSRQRGYGPSFLHQIPVLLHIERSHRRRQDGPQSAGSVTVNNMVSANGPIAA